MFEFLKKYETPNNFALIKELERQVDELESIRKRYTDNMAEFDKAISDAEELLKRCGYTDDDLEKMKTEARLRVIK